MQVGFHVLVFFPFSFQSAPPAAQESPIGDTADLLGLNSDPSVSSTSSSSAAHPGVQAGIKAASSNSDLLNDLFAPPAGQTAAAQEDLFYGGPPGGATPDSKRKHKGFKTADCIVHEDASQLSLMHYSPSACSRRRPV